MMVEATANDDECCLANLNKKKSLMTHLRFVSLNVYRCLAVHYKACSGHMCTYRYIYNIR
jgi:hypothetical protein